MTNASPLITCTRRIQFCAGHRVHGHENKCRFLHGHNFVALVTAEAPKLDEIGRVIDFSVLKQKIGDWIDVFWDHGMILWEQDMEARALVEGLHGQKTFALPLNPTSENLALYLLTVVGPAQLVGTQVKLTSVRVWETENCYSDASL